MSVDLEKEFATTAAQINVKLQEAAAAIKEATRLSQEFGLKGNLIHTQWTEELDLDIDEEECDPEDTLEAIFDQIDVSGLEGALDNAGWQTSSSYC